MSTEDEFTHTRSGANVVVPLPQSDRSGGVRLELRDISYEVTSRTGCFCWRKTTTKQILKNISGIVHPGDFVALMGASGAGKSTLLNILSRRIRRNEGVVNVNGHPADQCSSFQSNTCFIQQEDQFFGFLTVDEHLKHQSALRIPLEEEQRLQRAREVTEQFSLTKVKNSFIGNVLQGASRGISGGEKKRLSVASELLTNPSLIFADEPTSGLDAFMAESVVVALRDLALHGHTVVCTIHQPSSDVFAMFNKVLLLAEGRLVYYGPRTAAVPYFLRLGQPCPPYTNPADFLIEILSVNWDAPEAKLQELEQWSDEWQRNGKDFLEEWDMTLKYKLAAANSNADVGEGGKNNTNKRLATDTAPSTQQLASAESGGMRSFDGDGRVSGCLVIKTLLLRSIVTTARNPTVIRSRLIQAVLTALLGGLVYFRLKEENWYSKSGAVFFIMINQAFISVFTAVMTFMAEKQIILRERDADLFHLGTYYSTRILSDALFQFHLPIVYSTISWWMMGLNDKFVRFLLGLVFTWLTANSCASIGYLIGATVAHVGVAMAVGPVVLLPMLLVSGFVVQRDSLPKFWLWLYYLSPFQYGNSGLMRSVFLNEIFPNVEIGEGDFASRATGNEVLEGFGLSTSSGRWAVDLLALTGWVLGGRIIAGILFVIVNRQKKR